MSRLWLALAVLAGCGTPAPPPADLPLPDGDRMVKLEFPDLTALYGGATGIYRGCGPNGGVCHNARQYPVLSTLSSLVQNIGKPCNQLRDKPSEIDPLCERAGDHLRAGTRRYRIGNLRPLDNGPEPLRWTMTLGEPWVAGDEQAGLMVVRSIDGQDVDLYDFSTVPVMPSPGNPKAIELQLADATLLPVLTISGIPARSDAIQLWDPNGDGEFGVERGGALIRPGAPEKSYLIKRLTDPAAGSVMPLANCCFWTKRSLRALWCWIAGLTPDGSNAAAPISYARCPPGPVERIQYPEPGPDCESSRPICPVVPSMLTKEPSWPNVYQNLLRYRCAGSGCHTDAAAGGLDFSTEARAYETLVPARVKAGDAAASKLWQRVTGMCPAGEPCTRMPAGRDPLPQEELDLIRAWIERGAPRQG